MIGEIEMNYGIIGAMDEEIEYFKEVVSHYKEEKYHSLTFYKGEWYGHSIVFCKSGVGKVNAALTTQLLIDRYQVESLIFTGVAGAIDESLNIGDVVISSECQEHDIDATSYGVPRGIIPMYDGPSIFPASKKLIEEVNNAANSLDEFQGKVLVGKIVSGDKFVANKDEVDELRELFQASCVEMEGAAVAHVANVNQIPYIIIRSISDKANGEAAESFDQFVKSAAQVSAAIVENFLRNVK